MSTEDARRPGAGQNGRRGFAVLFGAVLAVLLVAVGAGAVAASAQGPRLSSVDFDAVTATQTPGGRVIFTANQPIEPVAEDQVTVSPAVEFSVDTVGRSVGVRFAESLRHGTSYTVTVRDVAGVSGRAPVVFQTDIVTPPNELMLLRRDRDGADQIVARTVGGSDERVVYATDHIEDFRAVGDRVVVSARNAAGQSDLVIVPLAGGEPRSVVLPGPGWASNLRAESRGRAVGFTWTTDEPDGYVSELFTLDIGRDSLEPAAVDVGASDPRIHRYRFVPRSSGILLLTYSGDLVLVGAGAEPTLLGSATAIDDISQDAVAYIRTETGRAAVDLVNGERTDLASDETEWGVPYSLAALPDGGSVTAYVELTEEGHALGQTVVREHPDAEPQVLAESGGGDAILQLCVARSGRQLAIVRATDIQDAVFDDYELSMPEGTQVDVISLDGDYAPTTYAGIAPSWCDAPAR